MPRRNAGAAGARRAGGLADMALPRTTMHKPGDNVSWWTTLPGVLTGIAAVVTAVSGLAALFWPRDDAVRQPGHAETAAGNATRKDASTPAFAPASAQGKALPEVTLVGADRVTFSRPEAATYSVLGLEVSNRSLSTFELRLRVRYASNDDRGKDFGDRNFRLLVDGVPRASDARFNLVIQPHSANEATLTFEVPLDVRSLALQVLHDPRADPAGAIALQVARSPKAVASE